MTADTVLRDGLRRRLTSTAVPDDRALAHEAVLDDLGLVGLLVDARLGGGGGSLTDAVTVQEELGRGHAATSFLPNSMMAVTAATSAGSESGDEVAAAIAAGDTVGVVLPFWGRASAGARAGDMPSPNSVTGALLHDCRRSQKPVWLLRAARSAADLVLEGRLLTPQPEGESGNLHAAPTEVREIARGERAERAIARSLSVGRIGLAADLNGSKARALEITVEYGANRRAFGRHIGSYQAFRHSCAESWMRIQLDRALLRAAMTAWEDETADADALATAAAISSTESARAIGESAILLHGGIGFTWEHEVHWHLKRANEAIGYLNGAAQQWEALYTMINPTRDQPGAYADA
ncbi:acyl-CoA dehydrogenase family protein [Gordonia rubripertincta]|uniref:Acyl-CoA dehydrogenase family protein n=1 Tax=Gordonia rubripertincta TaxID=36822 RepID=A0ABT4MWP5_GORRU|nr:acyl-CoA dehydrogenase family protein [Gordonia rubripertincta]MCZ4551433.1 acyl-CoA dehydrogenase family protein [Gordonia rubripertincta]